jgi:hypothetical protein
LAKLLLPLPLELRLLLAPLPFALLLLALPIILLLITLPLILLLPLRSPSLLGLLLPVVITSLRLLVYLLLVSISLPPFLLLALRIGLLVPLPLPLLLFILLPIPLLLLTCSLLFITLLPSLLLFGTLLPSSSSSVSRCPPLLSASRLLLFFLASISTILSADGCGRRCQKQDASSGEEHEPVQNISFHLLPPRAPGTLASIQNSWITAPSILFGWHTSASNLRNPYSNPCAQTGHP